MCMYVCDYVHLQYMTDHCLCRLLPVQCLQALHADKREKISYTSGTIIMMQRGVRLISTHIKPHYIKFNVKWGRFVLHTVHRSSTANTKTILLPAFPMILDVDVDVESWWKWRWVCSNVTLSSRPISPSHSRPQGLRQACPGLPFLPWHQPCPEPLASPGSSPQHSPPAAHTTHTHAFKNSCHLKDWAKQSTHSNWKPWNSIPDNSPLCTPLLINLHHHPLQWSLEAAAGAAR